MADLLINKKEYTDITEVQIPMADGSGNAIFKEKNNALEWFSQVFKYVGEYDIETVEGESYSYYALGGSVVADARAVAVENNTLSSYGYVTMLYVMKTYDTTQSDTIAHLTTVIINASNIASVLSSVQPTRIYSNNGGSVRLSGEAHTLTSEVYTLKEGTYLPITRTANVLTAIKADVYVLASPLT